MEGCGEAIPTTIPFAGDILLTVMVEKRGRSTGYSGGGYNISFAENHVGVGGKNRVFKYDDRIRSESDPDRLFSPH